MDVRTILLGVRAYGISELVVCENPGVFRKEAEQQAGEEYVEALGLVLRDNWVGLK